MKKILTTISTSLLAFAGSIALVYLLAWHAPVINHSAAINVNTAVQTGTVHPSMLTANSIIIFGSYKKSDSRMAVTSYLFGSKVN